MDYDDYEDNSGFDFIEEEYPIEQLENIKEIESEYEAMNKEDLENFHELYTKRVKALEDILQNHRRELTRITKALEVLDLPVPKCEKIEKIKDIWEPDPEDLLPDDIKTCHKIIIALRKIVRKNADSK